MASKKPFRFSVQGFNTDSASAWRETVQKAEGLGYSTFHLADHYIGPGPALEKAAHPVQDIAAVPAMAMAAEATKTINIGCRVFCTGYRPAPVLVKEAMTIDFLSGGRLELGLGAGWITSEYDAMGIPFDRPGLRIQRLEETVQLAKQAMAGERLNVQGDFVQVSDYDSVPKPANPKGVPIMIGGGAPRVLKLAGREADIVSINFNNRSGAIGQDGVGTSTHDETRQKVAWIKEGAGDRFDQVELEIGAYFTVVTDQAQAVAEQFGGMFGLPADEMLRHPHALFGTVDGICEELERRREEFGISYICVPNDVAEAFAPVVARLQGN